MKKIFFFLFLITSAQSFAQNNLAKTSIKTEIISPKQSLVNGFADTVEELLPAVVNISATQEIQTNNNSAIDLLGELPKSPLLDDFRNQLENQFRGQQGQKKKVSSIGSGFVISKDGSIVTNAHVVEDAVAKDVAARLCFGNILAPLAQNGGKLKFVVQHLAVARVHDVGAGSDHGETIALVVDRLVVPDRRNHDPGRVYRCVADLGHCQATGGFDGSGWGVDVGKFCASGNDGLTVSGRFTRQRASSDSRPRFNGDPWHSVQPSEETVRDQRKMTAHGNEPLAV